MVFERHSTPCGLYTLHRVPVLLLTDCFSGARLGEESYICFSLTIYRPPDCHSETSISWLFR